jgi:hypothetical protein
MDGHELTIVRESLEAVPDGEMAFGAAGDEAAEFGETGFGGEVGDEGPAFRAGNDVDVVNVRAGLEGAKGAEDNGFTGEGSEEFVEPHACGTAGGDDEGRGHEESSKLQIPSTKETSSSKLQNVPA